MSTLQIQIREELQQRMAARAAESGFSKVEDYVEALLEADCNDDEYDEELEELLIKRLNDGPGIVVTPEVIQQLKDEVRQRQTR
jgi:hypothetical protein